MQQSSVPSFELAQILKLLKMAQMLKIFLELNQNESCALGIWKALV